MTMPRYPETGCSAGSQVPGNAFPPVAAHRGEYVWGVNFYNGNSDYLNRHNNKAFVRLVRSVAPRECQDAQVSFRELFAAWRAARRNKVPSGNQLAFESKWIDELIALEERLNAGTWAPGPTTCFVAQRPKARQIHAPDFADRVMHHWLVPKLEAIFDAGLIYDSYANRRGKGTHAAVDRLHSFARQVSSGQCGGWYLQLDIRNFFNSIHRPTLYAMLRRRLERINAPLIVRRATHALLRRSTLDNGVVHTATAREREAVPSHKRLENAAPGCGLPIGNLSSQFFAN